MRRSLSALLSSQRGVMQVLPSTAAVLGLDADEPSSNVLAGVRYLELLFARFRSSDLALAAYNAGPTAVEKYGAVPPYRETRSYVAKIQTEAGATRPMRVYRVVEYKDGREVIRYTNTPPTPDIVKTARH